MNNSGAEQDRTFVQIKVTEDVHNKDGNAHNHLFYYNWPMTPRDPNTRNHPNTITGWNRKDRHKFKLILPADIDFTKDVCDVPWAEKDLFMASKTQSVKAEPAIAGKELVTELDGFIITINVARKNDWLITTQQGDQYYLSDKQFKSLYAQTADKNGYHTPLPNALKMARLTTDVCLLGPWGGLQYVPAGSVLAYRSQHDVYAIHKKSFDASYEIRSNDNIARLKC